MSVLDENDVKASKWLGWSIAIATCAFSAWGRVVDDLNMMSFFLACLFVSFQFATNYLCVWARQLGPLRRWNARACVGFAVVFGLFSATALDHAWHEAGERGLVEIDAGLSTLLLYFLPFAEPFIFWISGLLREEKLRLAEVAAATPIVIASASAAHAQDHTPRGLPPASQAPLIERAPITDTRSFETKEEKARFLVQVRGVRSGTTLAQEVGVSKATGYRWTKKFLDEMGAPVSKVA